MVRSSELRHIEVRRVFQLPIPVSFDFALKYQVKGVGSLARPEEVLYFAFTTNDARFES